MHTLFESGITKIQDLERYIKDDVIRHGSRLADLEKKLVNAYREATSVDILDDDALFGVGSEDEEAEAPFAMGLGGFSEAFDEDFLGLRELGIAAELGLSTLSIPKRLLKGKPGGGTGATKYVDPDTHWARWDTDLNRAAGQSRRSRHRHIRRRHRLCQSLPRTWTTRSGCSDRTFKSDLLRWHLPCPLLSLSWVCHLFLHPLAHQYP